jgi:hypothetical protein
VSSSHSIFGKAGASFLFDAVRGRDPLKLSDRRCGSSLNEQVTTFERDSSDRERIETVLLSLADELAYRLGTRASRSRKLVLKLRLHDFTTIPVARPSIVLHRV